MNNYLLLFIISIITVIAGCTLQEIGEITTNNTPVTSPRIFLNYCQNTGGDIYTTTLYNCSFYNITRDERQFIIVNKTYLKPEYPLVRLDGGFPDWDEKSYEEVRSHGFTQPLDIKIFYKLLDIPIDSEQELLYTCPPAAARPQPCTYNIYYYYNGQDVKIIRTIQEVNKAFLPLENAEAAKEYYMLIAPVPGKIYSIDAKKTGDFFSLTIDERFSTGCQTVNEIKMLRNGTVTETNSRVVKDCLPPP